MPGPKTRLDDKFVSTEERREKKRRREKNHKRSRRSRDRTNPNVQRAMSQGNAATNLALSRQRTGYERRRWKAVLYSIPSALKLDSKKTISKIIKKST
jgi:hypothetical protein